MRAERKGRERKTPRFETKKSLGQHFLNGKRVPTLMAEAADVKDGDVVLEIGPGTGALTRALLESGAKVVALEADERAVTVLQEAFKHEIAIERLVLFHTDVRALDVQSATLSRAGIVSGKYKVVANIPYYLSGHLFRTFLESENQPSGIVFLVQKEVAERIARDKKESLLSLSVKVYGDPFYIKTIGRGNFTPPPKVDSAVIAIHTISKERLEGVSEKDFFTFIHAGFGSKRKQLLGNLSSLYPRETLVHIFSTLGIRPDVRGEDLHLERWLELVRMLVLHK
jgi:16S rRNA (adenine1518-N6/adenine1519-N6)-dimethyltransferase